VPQSRWQDEIGPYVLTMQIIAGALMGGVVVFGTIAFFIAPIGGGAAGVDLPILTHLALGFAAVAIVGRWVIPGVVVTAGRKRIVQGRSPSPPAVSRSPQLPEFIEKYGDVARLIGLYQASLITGSAILEGAAFFCLVAFLPTREPICLWAAIVLVASMGLGFPTRSRVVHWVEDQQNVLQQQRHFQG